MSSVIGEITGVDDSGSVRVSLVMVLDVEETDCVGTEVVSWCYCGAAL